MAKLLIIAFALMLSGLKGMAVPVDSMKYGVFGSVLVFHPSKTPNSVVLFVSGDGGWDRVSAEMVKIIVDKGALVAGINFKTYANNCKASKVKCFYPASDFEGLSMTVQKKYKLKQYLKPILYGYSAGATLVYGVLAQAPANTFKGVFSVGFCPDIEMNKPLCNGSGLTSHVLKEGKSYYLEAAKHLTAPFIVMQGKWDVVCPFSDTKRYLDSIPTAELITLPMVGHGFLITKNWEPQFSVAYQKIVREQSYTQKLAAQNQLLQSQQLVPLNSDMPLTLNPTSLKNSLPLAFFISGDGGWTNFDQAICAKLAEKGMPAVGLDAQKYFWNEKQPRETADEITNAVKHYMQQWNKSSFILIGYSFGAGVVPFIASNISGPLKETLKGVFCLSPDETADFEIHISDMLNLGHKEKYNVISELKKITTLRPVCVFGNDEGVELRNLFSIKGVRVETLPGSHHYNNDFNALATIIGKDF